MRRWIGYAPLVVLLLHSFSIGVFEKGIEIEPCPKDNVCVNFVEDSCRVEGEMTAKNDIGVVWEASTECKRHTYDTVYARLEIKRTTLQMWSFIVTTHFDIEDIQFFFSKATLTFRSDKIACFTWKSGDEQHKVFLHMMSLPDVQTGSAKWKLQRYSFTIYANGEALINLFSGFGVTYAYKTRWITLKDARFAQLLEQPAYCKERNPLVSVCPPDGSRCANIAFDDHNKLTCPDQYYFAEEGKKEVEYTSIKCDKQTGKWIGKRGSEENVLILLKNATNIFCLTTDQVNESPETSNILVIAIPTTIAVTVLSIIIIYVIVRWIRMRRVDYASRSTSKASTPSVIQRDGMVLDRNSPQRETWANRQLKKCRVISSVPETKSSVDLEKKNEEKSPKKGDQPMFMNARESTLGSFDTGSTINQN